MKICGIRSLADADAVVTAGADMLGLNFVPTSKRVVSRQLGKRIARHCRGKLELVAVVADLSPPEIEELRREVGVDAVQLHGDELPEVLDSLPPSDFKAVRIATASDVADARRYRGPRLLVDAKVNVASGGTALGGTALGGTGHTFDWSLLGQLPRARQLILAGGLTPANVAEAILQVNPWGVDVASGVEPPGGSNGAPTKDADLIRAFVDAARGVD